MLVFRTPDEVREFSRGVRGRGGTVGFVPTMGALHLGHTSLVSLAARETTDVVMSIYVNPRQFNVRDDFDAYPRTMDSDLETAAACGVTAVYAPSDAEMYPDGFDTTVHVDRTAAPLEGAVRPGHFDGVATVVSKLFIAVEPDVAVFGQKDYQQLAVVRRMTSDLGLPVRIIGAETVRETDGLAMSSRNARLDRESRRAAPVIKRALDAAVVELRDGGVAAARGSFGSVIDSEPLARLEYFSVADAATLREVEVHAGAVVLSCAVWFGDVRLIDNVVVAP